MDQELYNELLTKNSEIVDEIHRGRVSSAIKMIKNNDIRVLNLPNKAGWYIMHFAAMCGYTDIIQELIDRGINTVCWDNVGQTPLHKAAQLGKIDSILVLLSNGAVVYTIDWHGHLPLQMAVEQRHVNAAEVLLMCGSEPKLQNWNWTQNPNMSTEDRMIFNLLKEYRFQIAGYKYGGIKIEVKRIITNSTAEMNEVGVIVDTKGQKSNFFLLVRRLHAEYTDIHHCLQEDQTLLSDIIEFRTWRFNQKEINFTILVEGSPRTTEELIFIANNDTTGKINDFIIIEENKKSTVSLTIKLAKSGITRFAIGCALKNQIISLSSRKAIIVPEMEPGALIDIPKGTFTSPSLMTLNVIETKEEDLELDETEEKILLSNAICISMKNNSQPNNNVSVTLPLHDTAKGRECMVATTSKNQPQSPKDWSIIPIEENKSEEKAVFSISHFSVYCLVDKTCNEERALSAIMDNLNKMRKMSFVVLAAPPEDIWPVVVVCGSIRKLRNEIKTWERKGYDMQGEISETFYVAEGQIFKIVIDGNVREVTEVNDLKLCFKNKTNYMAFELRIVYQQHRMEGIIRLFEEKEISEEETSEEETTEEETYPEVVQPCSFCFRGKKELVSEKKELVSSKPLTSTNLVTEIKISTNPKDEQNQQQSERHKPGQQEEQSREQEDEQARQETQNREEDHFRQDAASVGYIPEDHTNYYEEDHRDQSTIPVLSWKSFRIFIQNFTPTDAQCLGTQLGMSQENIQKLTVTTRGDVTTKRILVKWRGYRPHRTQVFTLEKALKACGMHDRAARVKHAFENDTIVTAE